MLIFLYRIGNWGSVFFLHSQVTGQTDKIRLLCIWGLSRWIPINLSVLLLHIFAGIISYVCCQFINLFTFFLCKNSHSCLKAIFYRYKIQTIVLRYRGFISAWSLIKQLIAYDLMKLMYWNYSLQGSEQGSTCKPRFCHLNHYLVTHMVCYTLVHTICLS